MKKIYIFGASKGGEAYLNRVGKDSAYLIAGFLDNDAKKHGSDFLGLPVRGADELLRESFDEVHLASMWSKEIRQQLEKELGISPEKIVDLPKAYLKRSLRPFGSPEGQVIGKRLITDICEYFAANDTYVILDGGCLLGIMREQMLLPWDDDIDFTTKIEDAGKVATLLKRFAKENPIRQHYDIEVSDSSATTGMQFISMTFVPKEKGQEDREIEISFTMITRAGDRVTVRSGMGSAPGHLHDEVRWIDLHPGRALCVAQTDEYLTMTYGDWRVVRQQFSFSDYQNWS